MHDTPLAGPLSIVALISARGGGDWPPVVALAVGLHARRHAVCLVCDTSTAAAVRATGLPTICVPPALEQGDIRLIYQQLRARGAEIGPETPNPFVEWAQVCAPAMRAPIQAHKPIVLFSSLFCMGLADQVASDLGVPWCFVNPSFYFGEDSARPWDADFLGLSARTFRYWFQPLWQRATLVLHATDAAFDVSSARLPGHHRYVGPLLWEPPMVAPAFLPTPGPPWVLVSLSTLPQDGEVAIARAAIRALTREAVRVLVTLALEHARAAFGEVPDHVYLSDYIPHSSVLPDSRLVISHAGHGIVMKALYHGVPMVLVPWGRDQPGVAARADALGVAAVVRRDACNDASVAQAVRRILDDALYAERVQTISKRLQAEDAVTVACAQLESLWASTAQKSIH
jgi:UDP:flavonoid glycosyltransferase YjiC (YdhE family)